MHDTITPVQIAPVQPGQRLELLDTLRGFALAGVLFVNMTTFSLYFFLSHPDMAALSVVSWDRWLEPMYQILAVAKFMTLFSLMFGIGFSLQMQRNGDDRDGLVRYVRRLAILLAIGMVHAYLFWWGDVLRYYAVLGLLLIPTRRWPVRTLVVVGLALLVLGHSLLQAWWSWPETQVASHADIYAMVVHAFGSQDPSTVLHGNRLFTNWWYIVHWPQVFLIASCLLIGSAIGRHGALRDPQRHARLWKRLLCWALPLGLLVLLALDVIDYGWMPRLSAWLDTPFGRPLAQVLNDLAVLALAIGYMAAIVALFARPGVRRWLRHLAPVGRMALSNYLTQTVVGITLFYGIGLGIGPRYGLVGVVVAWAALFAVQIAISGWWLARFRFGPMEWLWRTLTYGRWQPMRA